MPTTIPVLRALPDGSSCFDEAALDLTERAYAPPAPPFGVGEPAPADRWMLFEMPPGFVADWHPAPRRQIAVILAGRLEVQAGDGERRTMAPGDILLLEDLTGIGHVTRVLGDETARGLFVQLPGD